MLLIFDVARIRRTAWMMIGVVEYQARRIRSHVNILALASVLLLAGLVVGSCNLIGERILTDRTPFDYYLPEGFVGWAKITYGVRGVPPLQLQKGHFVVRFAANGEAQTSTKFATGFAKDSYWYCSAHATRERRQTGWGGGGQIWAGYVEGSTKEPPISEHFFVGSERQYYKAIGDPRGN